MREISRIGINNDLLCVKVNGEELFGPFMGKKQKHLLYQRRQYAKNRNKYIAKASAVVDR